jgi:hypothetical protein
MPTIEMLTRITEMGVLIPEVSVIETYLGRYPELAAVVEAMTQRTLRVFSARAQASLEMIRDRESDDHYIVLMVRFVVYPENVMDAIEEINRAFDPGYPQSEGWFYLTTDFQHPR